MRGNIRFYAYARVILLKEKLHFGFERTPKTLQRGREVQKNSKSRNIIQTQMILSNPYLQFLDQLQRIQLTGLQKDRTIQIETSY